MSIFCPSYFVYSFVFIIITEVGSASVNNAKLSKHPVLLLVSFDGFRFDYMAKARMPTLRLLQNEGVSVPYMIPQFPTKTFPNHQSIATGVYPDIHGITDNVVFDPLFGKKLSGYADDPGFWNYHPDVLPFWIRNEQAGGHSGCYMWAGSSQGYGLSGRLLPTYYIPKYNGSVPWETRVETVLAWMTDKVKPANVVFLYHNEPDSQGHAGGADDPEMIREIENVDKRVAHLIQKLKDVGIYEHINLVILSDHGMQTVHKENIINTTTFIDPQTYYRNGGSPLFHIQPKNSDDVSMIYDTFKTASLGKNFSVFRKNELGHFKYGKNRRVMEIVLLADPSYAFEDIRPNSKGIYGVHGYDNRNSNMTTIFMARGPNFKKGFKSLVPIENVDLFPMFSKIMGVPAAPNNGSLAVVSEFLVDSSSCKVKLNLLLGTVVVYVAGLC